MVKPAAHCPMATAANGGHLADLQHAAPVREAIGQTPESVAIFFAIS